MMALREQRRAQEALSGERDRRRDELKTHLARTVHCTPCDVSSGGKGLSKAFNKPTLQKGSRLPCTGTLFLNAFFVPSSFQTGCPKLLMMLHHTEGSIWIALKQYLSV